MKTVMMVGGGIQQMRAVKIVKSLGYKIIVTDRYADAPCCAIADKAYVLDGRDIEGLMSLVWRLHKKGQLDGIFTLTEMVTSVAVVSQVIGIPGTEILSAIRCQDKGWAKQEWLKKKVSTPKGRIVTTLSEAQNFFSDLGREVILKPVKGFGGMGVKRMNDKDDLKLQFETISGVFNQAWLIEEYLSGSSHDVNGLFDADRTFHPMGIVDRSFAKDSFAELEIRAPTCLDAHEQEKLYELLEESALALGISWGPVKGDAIYKNGSFYMLEIAPRLHGPKCSLYALPEIGCSPWPTTLQVLTGKRVPSIFPLDRADGCFISRAILSPPGEIKQIAGVDIAIGIPGVVEIFIFKREGEFITLAENSTDIIGFILVKGPNFQICNSIISDVLSTISIEIDCKNIN